MLFVSFSLQNSFKNTSDIFTESFNKKFLHTIYFSEFASQLVYGFVTYTSEYIHDNRYNISTVSLEKISNIFKIK